MVIPDLLVDGIQLLLKHHGQSLGIGMATWRQQVHGAEKCFPIIIVDVRHLSVTLKWMTAQNTDLLRPIPLMIAKGFYLSRN